MCIVQFVRAFTAFSIRHDSLHIPFEHVHIRSFAFDLVFVSFFFFVLKPGPSRITFFKHCTNYLTCFPNFSALENYDVGKFEQDIRRLQAV